MRGVIPTIEPTGTRSLSELEAVIETGMTGFMAVGSALLEIRERRLYQERGYTRFEDYFAERFEISRPRAYQLMNAVTAHTAMSTFVDIPLPTREGHMRELTSLANRRPEMAAQVWQDVYEATNGNPDIRTIREAVREATRKEDVPITPSEPLPVSPVEISLSREAVAERHERLRQMVAAGRRDAEIAAALGLALNTVRHFIYKNNLPTEMQRTGGLSTKPDAVRERHEQIRRMAHEGYRDAQIAEALGISAVHVTRLVYEFDLPTEAQRIGRKSRRIDHDAAITNLIESCTPTPETLGAIDLSQIDRSRLAEWDSGLSSAIQTLTKLRTLIRKLSEGVNGR